MIIINMKDLWLKIAIKSRVYIHYINKDVRDRIIDNRAINDN